MKRTIIIILIVLAFIAALVAAWYFLYYKPEQDSLLEGSACTIGKMPGKYQDGVCVPLLPNEEPLPGGKKLK